MNKKINIFVVTMAFSLVLSLPSTVFAESFKAHLGIGTEIVGGAATASEETPVEIIKNEYDLGWLKKAKTDHVCMVTNKLFTDPQIPVEVNGKTYYGCCQMCKGKLEASSELRESIDPISNNKVDKASAVIGYGPDKSVYYFENEENMKKFDMQKKGN